MQKAHETNTRTPQELIQLITLKNGQYILHFQQPIMQCLVILKHIKKFAKTYHIKISVFFLGEFSQQSYKGIFLEKIGSSCHIMREKNLKWSHLENRFRQVAIL